ncbi:hypothetical protein O6H91_20G036400 [Diphasiastrum complanatum]|uniref:Uncharacterized protein n=1 Tax=Diphasiastrum complanatum TaxID=34168 RepID=A0ACC2AP64_DIPCM|nr:hypothetical protein O6H91_20G036400 [Diphasiastrum complanatum]
MAQSQAEQMPNGSTFPYTSRNGVDLERRLRMQEGVGDESYAQNSSFQAGIIESTQYLLMQALEKVQLPRNGPVRVADLGCSSGPNTLSVVSDIVDKLQHRYESEGQTVPEFQAFLSDLPSNDFNTLFSLLPPYLVSSQATTANDLNKRCYFAAGVPGSFYRRLFPSASLHTVLTTHSLHWLSKVPEAVQNKYSPAWNPGRTWISPSNKLAAEEYSKQAKEDLSTFLEYRAQEMASGSVLFVLMTGRDSAGPEQQFSFLDTDNEDFFYEWLAEIDSCWNDLIKEGVIEQEVGDSFNLPMYLRNVEEFKEAVRESSKFSVHFVKLLKTTLFDITEMEAGDAEAEKEKVKNRSFSTHRSLFGPLVEEHAGSSVAQLFFQQLKARADKNVKLGKASSCAFLAASITRN